MIGTATSPTSSSFRQIHRSMASLSSSSHFKKPVHLVALPYPGRGHINPMLNLCSSLLARLPNLTVTFIVTEEWLGFLRSDPEPPPGVRYVSIPNVIPSERVRSQDMRSFLSAVMTKMEGPCQEVIQQMKQPADFIIADMFLFWAVEVGRLSDVPVALLWPMSATVFSMFHHFDLLKQHGHFPIDLRAMADVRVDYIPGVSPTPLSAFPIVMHGKGLERLEYCLAPFASVSESDCLLLSTVFELEPSVVDALRSELHCPIYTVGPSFPHGRLIQISQIDNQVEEEDYIAWLNRQDKKSVLYISFGSFCKISDEQMDEIAAGMAQSGVKFMWVARDDAQLLRETCRGGDDGLIVPWCDQLRVLAHEAVGGFWTHCGWSSTQEGFFTGVTFLTFPLVIDQEANSKLIVDDFKVGWRIKGPTGDDGVVKRDEIGGMVRRFMDGESEEVKEMRLRAEDLRRSCVRAVDADEAAAGSYEVNLTSFVDLILSCSDNTLT